METVHYEKAKEVQQGPNENPAVFSREIRRKLLETMQMRIPFAPRDSPFGCVFRKPAHPRHQHKIQRQLAGPQNPINDLLQLAYSVFIIGMWPKRLNAWRRDKTKAQ